MVTKRSKQKVKAVVLSEFVIEGKQEDRTAVLLAKLEATNIALRSIETLTTKMVETDNTVNDVEGFAAAISALAFQAGLMVDDELLALGGDHSGWADDLTGQPGLYDIESNAAA